MTLPVSRGLPGHMMSCAVVIAGRVENWVAPHPRPLARAIAVRLLFLASPKGDGDGRLTDLSWKNRPVSAILRPSAAPCCARIQA